MAKTKQTLKFLIIPFLLFNTTNFSVTIYAKKRNKKMFFKENYEKPQNLHFAYHFE